MPKHHLKLIKKFTQLIWPGKLIAIVVPDDDVKKHVKTWANNVLWGWSIVVITTGDELPGDVFRAFVFPDVDQGTIWFDSFLESVPNHAVNVAFLPT